MLERKLYSLPAELLLFWGWQENFNIKDKLSPAEARAELGNIKYYMIIFVKEHRISNNFQMVYLHNI